MGTAGAAITDIYDIRPDTGSVVDIAPGVKWLRSPLLWLSHHPGDGHTSHMVK